MGCEAGLYGVYHLSGSSLHGPMHILRQSYGKRKEGWCPGCQDSVGIVGVRDSFAEQAILGWVL